MGARWRSGARRFAATAARRDRARASARVGANVAGRVPRWSTRGVRDCVGRASREGGRARSVAAFARTSAQARRGAALGAAVSEFGSPPRSTLVSRTKARPGARRRVAAGSIAAARNSRTIRRRRIEPLRDAVISISSLSCPFAIVIFVVACHASHTDGRRARKRIDAVRAGAR
ncbi:hypothetical protein [Burkholderia pseudomallei]|uniref:hypothetical protein n=1 Tax=Burkholderia pseudomallei TaxID=28450 RepID=UPI00057268EB|nr:hypothetical protein [Burkholderia pseudomallei]